ncbi:MAG: tRNA pseudouridine(38-40) synthase TruA [Gemmatimonadota bacterium]|nr:tRNA pseudouridine(38-40) synthase TruA [Gemmatimonadota bacterium]
MEGSLFAAEIHYRGSDFSGWQRQSEDRTVQGVVEEALATLANQPVTIHAAGRTDAGVHALGQVASFALPKDWIAEDLRRALNGLTPYDVWIAKVAHVPDGFHARKSALARRYRYLIGSDAASKSPFRRPYEWDLAAQLDFAVLQKGAETFLGRHNFKAFSAVGQEKPHYECSIAVSEWTERASEEGYIFTVEADRFLHRMVRFLVGIMVDAARGRRPVEDIGRLLESDHNGEASPPAPPQGLYMVGARYPESVDIGLK